jgi:hypothetical protein
MKLPLTVAALLLLSIASALTATSQKQSCSCKAPDGSCEANVTCSRHGCTAICGSKDGCYSACGKDTLLTRFTLRLVNKDSRQIASALSKHTGKQIDFVPRQRNSRFTIDVKGDDLWNALDYLHDQGVVTVNGVNWDKYRQIRGAALEGRKLSVNFNNMSVSDALVHLSFLTGKTYRVESGDAEKVISTSLQEVTLSELISRISEQTGVRIMQAERSASLR